MSNRAGYPLYAAVNITTRCNLDCTYCYLQPRSNLDISLNDFKKVIDDLYDNSVFFVHISGGEPFLHPDLINIVDYACSKFKDVSVLTNGTVIREEHLKYFSDLTKRVPLKIQVSIDSVFPEINLKTRKLKPGVIINNIKKLKETGVLIAAGMVVTKYNIDTLVESITQLKDYVKYFHIMCIQDIEYNPHLEENYLPDGKRLAELWNDLSVLQEKYALDISKPVDFEKSNYKGCAYGAPCAAAFTYLVIDPDLNLRPCDKLNSIILGNIKNSDIRTVWNSKTAKIFLNHETPLCMSKRNKFNQINIGTGIETADVV